MGSKGPFRFLRKFLAKILNFIFTFIFSLLLLIIGPVLFTLALPVFIYRYLIKKLAPIVRPELGKMMTTRSNICSPDDFYGEPRTNLVVMFETAGDLDIDQIRQLIMDKMINAKDTKGNKMYPELCQYLTSWAGFKYFTQDPHFDIKNHANYYQSPDLAQNEMINFEKMCQIKKELFKKPFSHKRALWEAIVVRNYIPKDLKEGETHRSIFIPRFHHCLADGFAIISSLLRLSEETLDCVAIPKSKKIEEIKSRHTVCLNKLASSLGTLYKIVKTPYDIADQLMPFLKPNLPLRLSKEISLCVIEPIPFEYIRTTAKLNDVSVSAVICCGFTSAVRNYFIQRNKSVPKYSLCIFPLPAPGHSLKMRNFMSFFLMKLPIGIKNPFKRLKNIENQLISIKNSILPAVFFNLIPLFGSLFPFMLKNNNLSFYDMTTLSSFPGPRSTITLLDYDVTNISFGSGLCPTNLGLLMTGLTYNGYFYLLGLGDKSIMPTDKEMIDEFEFSVHRELQILSKGNV